jgi:hypothetical protein
MVAPSIQWSDCAVEVQVAGILRESDFRRIWKRAQESTVVFLYGFS